MNQIRFFNETTLDMNEVVITIKPPQVKKKSFYIDLDLIEECINGEE